MAQPASGTPINQVTATSSLLDPAALAIIASAKFDERGITAYCLDLPGTLRQHAGARGAHDEEIAAHLEEALAFLRRQYGEPVFATTADRFTAYYWWSLPGGVRLHLVHTDKVVADLWVTRLDAADVPAGADEPDLRGEALPGARGCAAAGGHRQSLLVGQKRGHRAKSVGRGRAGAKVAGRQGSRASDFFQPATLAVEVANGGWPAARVQYLLRGRACAVSPWPGVRTYGVWPQVLFTAEDGERAEIWVDRPLPSQDDELLLRGRYVAGRGEIESPGENAGEGSGEGAGPGAGEGAGPGAGEGAGPGAGEGGRVEVLIARPL